MRTSSYALPGDYNMPQGLPLDADKTSSLLSDLDATDPGAASAGDSLSPGSGQPVRVLSETDAIELWLARWLKTPRKTIRSRYACDPRRIYEVWEGTRYPGSRAKAIARLKSMYPGLADQIDVSRHKRIPRGAHPGQLSLFQAD